MIHYSIKNRTQIIFTAVFTAIFIVALIPTSAAASAWHDWQNVEEPAAYKVLQFLDSSEQANLVLITAGTKERVLLGTVFKTYRSSPAPRLSGDDRSVKPGVTRGLWIETGRLKVIDVQEDYSVAEIVQQSSAVAKALFTKFPGVMAGDLAVAQRQTIVARQAVTPTTILSYNKLFVDPKSTPQTFELSAAGVEILREAAAAFATAKLSLLMVEGYTDTNGPSDANQVESYQRALTVRQYLVDEFGFDGDRVVAVGFGEGEQVDVTNAPGYVEANRRIVIKAVPIPQL
jgi:outer membrane protein OmpA-like peptidoglycan-associated protein